MVSKRSADSGGSAPRARPEVEPLLELRQIYKEFGAVRALRGADLRISRPGVVHGLIGANGSGKSTLLGILSGQLRPDAGVIRMSGEEVRFRNPGASLAQGIAMVSQETALAQDLSVAENVLMGRRLVKGHVGLDWRRTNEHARSVLGRLALDFPPGRTVRDFRPDQQQMIEIARALSLDARILILDEPTSSLSEDEVENLFRAVRHVVEQSVSVIFVSHRLDELLDIAEEFTVLRDGRRVLDEPREAVDAARLVAAMAGDTTGERRRRADWQPSPGPPALEVTDLSEAGVLSDIRLSVAPGEAVGLAGLVGAGRSQLLEAIFGVRPRAEGRIVVGDVELAGPDAARSMDAGLGYVPPDRKSQGVILLRSIGENLAMVATRRRSRLRSARDRAVEREVGELMERLRIRADSARAAVGTLSGGNQQKVALGKWLIGRKPKVLLLDEPTRGVDVGAKAEIHELLRELMQTDQVAILVSSSEDDELLSLCHRVLFLDRGRVTGEIDAPEATESLLAHLGSDPVR